LFPRNHQFFLKQLLTGSADGPAVPTEGIVNLFAALVAADHIQDLLREAEEDRRIAAVRAANRPAGPTAGTIGTTGLRDRLAAFAGRSRSTTGGRSPQRPAEAWPTTHRA
jgi:hypothetical protein